MDTVYTFMLWGSLVALAYSYVGYPALVWCLARRKSFRSARRTQPVDRTGLPNVTVLIAAHNAEHHVKARIENLLASDYPLNRLRVVVASDGSTDQTVARTKSFNDPSVVCLDFRERRGKAATLIHAIDQLGEQSAEDVLLFTDITTRFASDAILRLTANFLDPTIGVVSGHVTFTNHKGQPAESFYWKCEMMVRRCEAQLGIMLGASGAIYAMRFPLFVPPESAVINDDMVFPTLVRLRHGVNVKLDETARAFVTSDGSLAGEFRRRRRIGVGAAQCVLALKELFQPKHLVQVWAFASHKLLRWASPLFLLIAAVSNSLLLDSVVHQMTALMQIGGYAMAGLGTLLNGHGFVARLSRAATSFVVMNAALAAGFVLWIQSPRNVIWTPTSRPVENDEARSSESPVSMKSTVWKPMASCENLSDSAELPRKAS